MVIIFDLDDTLYDELSYVVSGLRCVAQFLEPIIGEKKEHILLGLKEELTFARSHIFDRFLKKKGFFTKKLVKQCVSVYRQHIPKIELYPEAKACLKRLQNYPLYLVTDGNTIVQQKKIEALGLKSVMRGTFCTYRYGLHNSKPSPYCFMKIAQLENVSPNQVVYVADNQNKDFVGIKPLGFHTIQVLTGQYKDLCKEASYQAECIINNLNELTENLLKKIERG